MSTMLTKLSLLGDNKKQTNFLQKVFVRAGILDENFKNNIEEIDEGQSILIVKNDGDLNKYRSYLKKINIGIDIGKLSHGFVWFPDSNPKNNENLESLISSNLSRKITFSRHQSVIRFAEDVIKTLETDQEKNIKNENKNMSIFFNILDNEVGSNTCEMLSEIFKINSVVVDSSDDSLDFNDFSNFAFEAKVIVVIYDDQKEWAEIFTQEIWKKIGGVSSGIPILLIGTDSNKKSNISVPNLTVVTVSKELLALEVKVQYDELSK